MADLQSFEVAEGDAFGDLLSGDRIRSRQPIKVGLLSGGFFEGWRMLISGGEILDVPVMPICDGSLVVRLERPIKEYVEILTKQGVPHHCIAVRGNVRKQLGQLADLMGMQRLLI